MWLLWECSRTWQASASVCYSGCVVRRRCLSPSLKPSASVEMSPRGVPLRWRTWQGKERSVVGGSESRTMKLVTLPRDKSRVARWVVALNNLDYARSLSTTRLLWRLSIRVSARSPEASLRRRLSPGRIQTRSSRRRRRWPTLVSTITPARTTQTTSNASNAGKSSAAGTRTTTHTRYTRGSARAVPGCSCDVCLGWKLTPTASEFRSSFISRFQPCRMYSHRCVVADSTRLPTHKEQEKARLLTYGGKTKLWPHDSKRNHGATSKKVRPCFPTPNIVSSQMLRTDGEGWVCIHPTAVGRRHSHMLLLRLGVIRLGRRRRSSVRAMQADTLISFAY